MFVGRTATLPFVNMVRTYDLGTQVPSGARDGDRRLRPGRSYDPHPINAASRHIRRAWRPRSTDVLLTLMTDALGSVVSDGSPATLVGSAAMGRCARRGGHTAPGFNRGSDAPKKGPQATPPRLEWPQVKYVGCDGHPGQSGRFDRHGLSRLAPTTGLAGWRTDGQRGPSALPAVHSFCAHG